jgi:type VI secretion system protein ImpK
MSGKDDPFGLYDAGDRTVFTRPQPGGRGPAPRPSPSAPPAYGSSADLGLAASHRNPLVAAAGALLSLAPQLKTASPPSRPEDLRERVLAELRRFEDRATAQGVPHRLAQQTAWSLSALIDDIVLNTPWGRHSSWPQQNLVATLFREVNAGERFFERLAELERDPGQNRDLLEVMYLCLALGFEGRYRISTQRSMSIADLRDGLYRSLRRPEAEAAELSPHWRGLAVAQAGQGFRVPRWVLLAGTVAILLLLYTGFSFRLAGYTDRLGALVQALPPSEEVQLPHEQGQAVASAVAARVPYAVLPKIQAVLGDEIQQGTVEGSEDATSVRVRLRDEHLFSSGSAEMTGQFKPLVIALAGVLAQEPGPIRVVGHTDNVPIRTARFASNWALSEARALTVGRLLVGAGVEIGRIEIDGRADTEPVATNDTPAGRAANRRVEVLLFKEAPKQ